MPFSKSAMFDPIRTLGFAAISATYAKLGVALLHPVRAFRIVNQTDGDMFVTITNGSIPLSDGTADELIVPAGTFVLWDVSSDSSHFTNDPAFTISKGDQFWVRQSTVATVRNIFLECLIPLGE
jgi:hypothetical protein